MSNSYPLPKYEHDLAIFIGDLRSRIFSSYSKAADYFGVNHSTIKRYEDGEIKLPPLGYVMCLSELIVERLEPKECAIQDVQGMLLKELNQVIFDYYPDQNRLKSWDDLCSMTDIYMLEQQDRRATSTEVVKEFMSETPSHLSRKPINPKIEGHNITGLGEVSEKSDAYQLPYSFLDFSASEIVQWISGFQRKDGSFPSEQKDSYSCTWTTARIYWGLLMISSLVDEKCLRSFLSWLISNQNDDGGLGFIKRGDFSIVDASSEYLIALVHAVKHFNDIDVQKQLTHCLEWLVKNQTDEGGWNWNPNSDEAPMVTSTAFATLGLSTSLQVIQETTNIAALEKGWSWLAEAQNRDGGWGSYSGTPSRTAPTALAIWGLADASRVQKDIKKQIEQGIAFLRNHQQMDGSWSNTIERSSGLTITRLSTPLCITAMLRNDVDPTSSHILRGYSALMQTYDTGRFFYNDTGIFTWPTADGLMAIATFANRLGPQEINRVINSYLVNLSKLQFAEDELARLKSR